MAVKYTRTPKTEKSCHRGRAGPGGEPRLWPCGFAAQSLSSGSCCARQAGSPGFSRDLHLTKAASAPCLMWLFAKQQPGLCFFNAYLEGQVESNSNKTHTVTHTHTVAHTHTVIHPHILTYTFSHSHTLTFTHIHILALTHSHTHTHTQSYNLTLI